MKTISIILVMMLIFTTSASAFTVSVSDYDPKPAEAGKFVNVWFKVDNPTSEQGDGEFYLEIIPKDGLEISQGEENVKRVGLLPPSASPTILFRLKVRSDAFEGPNTIETRLFNDEKTIEKTVSIEVVEKDLLEVDFDIGDIDSDPSRIKPDDEDVELKVTLLNLGDATAKAVKAELIDLPQAIEITKSYSGSYLLGNVASDGQSSAVFNIDIDKTVKPGDYNAKLRLSYKFKPDEDEDEYLIETRMIPLILSIKATPLYNITKVETIPEQITAGDDGVKVRLTIQNIGEEKGESVRIKAFAKTEQPFFFDDNSDFIAPILEPGETGQGTLEFDVEDNANLQIFLLDLEIKNIVGSDVVTSEHTIPIQVVNEKPRKPWRIVLIGLALIAAYVIYIVIRKKK